jgi:farnesyl diphosphate synthase
MNFRFNPSDPIDLQSWIAAQLQRVEMALDQLLSFDPPSDLHHQAPAELMAAMRYAVLDGGKRMRPLLVLATYETVNHKTFNQVNDDAALRAACAVELIHAYSLVHDDMPCMDNDVLRRGKPTVHVQFGEASALLAGDAMQALAFELLTPEGASMRPDQQAMLCRLLSRAAGCVGMAGGQAIDLASVGLTLSQDQLQEMHRLKTGALLQASVMMGAACAVTTPTAQAGLQTFGAAIGLAFQVVDDILDVVADSSTLGKTAGKDADHDKPTYVSLMGLEGARAYAQSLHHQALLALEDTGLSDTRLLQGLADMVVQRSN